MDASYNPLVLGLGVACCALAVGWGLRGLAGDRRRRRGVLQRRRASHMAFRQHVADAAKHAQAQLNRGLAWEGRRTLRVAAVVDESDDCKSFYLVSPDGRPLPAYLPGQYLTLHLPCESGGKPVVRCYSLSDRPREEYYRCTVKRQGPPPGSTELPPGVGSNYLHDHVDAGDLLSCEAPRGPFYLLPGEEKPVVLIGGGIGLTPVVSMLNAIHHTQKDREVYFFAGARRRHEFPFREHLRQLAEQMPGLKLYTAYSQPDPRDVPFKDYHHHGRLTVDYLRSVLPSSNFDFYLCGPPALMQSLAPALLEWGVADDQIHFEAFGPASVRLPSQRNPAAEAIGEEVHFLRQQRRYTWEAGDECLLDLAARHGVPVFSGCRAGNCGQCAVRLVSGKVATLRASGATPPEGHCLACISVPEGPVEIDA